MLLHNDNLKDGKVGFSRNQPFYTYITKSVQEIVFGWSFGDDGGLSLISEIFFFCFQTANQACVSSETIFTTTITVITDHLHIIKTR
jgi:hypothetical protein